jgi:hypothetical protein
MIEDVLAFHAPVDQTEEGGECRGDEDPPAP